MTSVNNRKATQVFSSDRESEYWSVLRTKSLPLEFQPCIGISEFPLAQSCRIGAMASVAVAEAHPSPEELVAKARAPVKIQFLCPPPPRNSDEKLAAKGDGTVLAGDDVTGSTSILTEKKSKRQLKRERRQELKSSSHLCPEVAKTGDFSSCPYGENCRFSHDVDAFNAQKPQDLDGVCPFLNEERPCPYGLSCRFSGTHKVTDTGIASEDASKAKRDIEMNLLRKNVQKLLWKNKMKFPKAHASLKFLAQEKKKINDDDDDDDNGGVLMARVPGDIVQDGRSVGSDAAMDEMDCVAQIDKIDGSDISDEQGLSKKTKCSNDESCLLPSSDEQDSHKKIVYESHEKSITDCSVDENDKSLKLHPREKKLIDFRGKLYLAPLTTVGNLPFRRVCKALGADVTCGEMAMCTNLLQGQASEWALLRRHSSEDLFGVQICGAYPDTVTKTVELIEQQCMVDFIDINMGCPIDVVVNKGAGSALLTKPMRMKSVVEASCRAVDTPLTIKVRTGYFEGKNRIDSLISDIGNWGACSITIHGRTRQQRYSKLADWDYIYQCARGAPKTLQVLGNGDVFSYVDWNNHMSSCPELASCMIARGALIKPWIFTEIKEQRHWDISSGERLDMLKDYARFGLQHWGSDSKGVETTRHFLLEWLSYCCRYIPVSLLDVIPQKINWRPPSYFGRDDMETLMASESAADWIRISEMLLGKVPSGFTFSPKHKSNAYDKAENG
ncbi:hypothetical protein M569_09667 [Genlisea aurea]|uniref:tRNA-dihydrouridine(47) synthase [NAD(P)(+)] n=1 Tax=Genlisea aurea TaxID=192259 RepID=S8DPT5_9LAMI|nr:hypothetical protein M569_09667 [Genlisea aurea]